ncbi:NAD(P)-binding protein [Aaosphaeria arxii CBS 175.79]|uniref:NAD(P)-binding protein n=1 Tax=Aaosphaeria arxii CBS 175.79 TaxID=1450172 RepID=A0A6A5Y4J1_9PLEO|nr:NAD(P)-binding protein [Aaosphaeria arxii CBS 175.79]KAF2020418.1 NAD(P)-binding protein [Aaosphaeria arxii CBS 175.79]
MSPIKVGIVGYGGSAKSFHLPFIAAIPDYEIVAILQRAEAPSDPTSVPKGSHCTVDFPNVKHHRTAESFFADSNIDFVVVATHTDTHASFATQALMAGKHVLVDKPFASSADEADQVIQLAKEKRLLLTCFQNRRYDGGFQTVRELIKKDAFGTITEAEIHYDFDRAPWLHHLTAKEYTPGSGHTFGLGTHSLDQAYAVFGRPASVTAFYRVQRGIESEVEDSFTVILQYSGAQKNLLVTVKTCVVSPMEQQLKFWIRGTKGSYIKFQQRSTCPQEEQIAQGKDPLDPDFAAESEQLCGTLTTYDEFDSSIQRFDDNSQRWVGKYPTVRGRWMQLYQDVADALNGKSELPVKADEVRDVLRLIELARESHEKGATIAWK